MLALCSWLWGVVISEGSLAGGGTPSLVRVSSPFTL